MANRETLCLNDASMVNRVTVSRCSRLQGIASPIPASTILPSHSGHLVVL